MDVSLHRVDLDQPDTVVAALAPTLDAFEQTAAETRTLDGARRRYVVAHGAVRLLLAARLDRDATAVRFDRRCRHCGDATHGKPAVANADGCSFSLSHAGDVALVAIGVDAGRIGVDVEVQTPRRHLDRLAARVMTDDEYAAWRGEPVVHRLDAFLRVWTAKEAYLKATGHGLAQPLRTTPAARDGWSLFHSTPMPHTIAALAVEQPAATAPVAELWDPGPAVTLAGRW